MINRSALVIKVKQPFLDWLKLLPDPSKVTLEEANRDSTVYLLSELWSDDAQEEMLKLFFGIIFEDQLNGWWTEKQDWPKKRDFALFKKWFDVELHSIVHDLVDAPLEDDDVEH